MENGYVTTPFGRRSMTLGMLASQQLADKVEPGTIRSKWKLFRACCEARPMLGVTERSLTVLDALLSFLPGDELVAGQGLVVFPSNAQLSLRARGMAPATLRRHLAVLVETGLVARKDSPNGKRYARRGGEGEIDEAYGFSLTPLLARASEIETMAAQVIADREFLRVTRERLTICRRDVAKLIASAMEENVPGNWEQISVIYRRLVDSIPRSPTIENLSPVLEELAMLRDEIVNILEMQLNSQKMNASESHIERHIQNSNPDSLTELEPCFEKKQGEELTDSRPVGHRPVERLEQTQLKSFPLGLVLQACPQIADYGPGGKVGNWRDLMSAAVIVRSMLGVSPSAYEDACLTMGPENAATIIACILERGGHINSAGGYLRDLTRRAERSEFAIGPMLMALARANSPATSRTG
ncbi:plasmid replication protein RepC [Oryzicola mucosus]|uniref:Replication initiation protein RepC n=1 Tax=Oryzicola mucosus TaxID=2767425 RepID=A0A8J6PX61_9HYPH|nr:plasmid replication protein RepC [Oryzicola mucosus]MBD0416806.1 replication initiation protein RepC [Oryzicola mucosus]